MKNNILLVSLACSLILFSCGTLTRTAQNTQPGFVNSIYFTPDQAEELAYNQSKAELAQMQNETTSFLNGRKQTIYVGDTNVVDIAYNPNLTYSIVDDDESYEARLRKFDSPVYTVNIEMDNHYSYIWHNPWFRHGYGWYDPWYATSWYSPYHGWCNPWHYGHSFGWYDPWYTTSWYSPYYGWYDPWHYSHVWYPAPFPNHSQPHRDIYYGHRGSSPSYNANTGRGGSSYNRNMANVSQIRGNGTRQQNTVKASNSQPASSRPSQGSMYRRSASQNTRSSASSSSQQNVEYRSGSHNQNSNSHYRNTNYNRGNSSNSYGSAPVRSSGGSSGSYSNQRTGSGSSYRR